MNGKIDYQGIMQALSELRGRFIELAGQENNVAGMSMQDANAGRRKMDDVIQTISHIAPGVGSLYHCDMCQKLSVSNLCPSCAERYLAQSLAQHKIWDEAAKQGYDQFGPPPRK